MNFNQLFSKKAKSPADLIRGLRDAVHRLDVGQSGSESRRKVSLNMYCPLQKRSSEGLNQASEEISKILYAMKVMLYGEGGE